MKFTHLKPEDVADKIPEVKQLFMERYEAEIDNGTYDMRDVARLMAKNDYVASFLTARSAGDVEKALQHVDKVFRWRKEQNIWDWTDETFPEALKSSKAIYYQGEDKNGFPILYIRSRQDPGSENVMDLVKKYISFLIDQHHRDNPGQRCVALFDMSPPGETSLSTEMGRFFMEIWENFPSFLAYSISYDLPWFLSGPAKALMYLMSEEMKKMYVIVSKEEIRDYIPEEHLWPHMKNITT